MSESDGRQYLRSHLPARVSGTEASWRHWPDGHALSDWNRALHEDSPRSRDSAAIARRTALGIRCSRIDVGESLNLEGGTVPRLVLKLSPFEPSALNGTSPVSMIGPARQHTDSCVVCLVTLAVQRRLGSTHRRCESFGRADRASRYLRREQTTGCNGPSGPDSCSQATLAKQVPSGQGEMLPESAAFTATLFPRTKRKVFLSPRSVVLIGFQPSKFGSKGNPLNSGGTVAREIGS
jgi:hypothetical protein